MKRSRRWLTRALSLGLVYLVLAVLVHAPRWPERFILPWWAIPAAALVVYVGLALTIARRAPFVRRMLAVVVLGALHATLGAVTALVYALLGAPLAVAFRDAFWICLPAPLLQMLTAPLIAAPLRGRLYPRPAPGQRASRTRRPVVPTTSVPSVAWPVASAAAETPGDRPPTVADREAHAGSQSATVRAPRAESPVAEVKTAEPAPPLDASPTPERPVDVPAPVWAAPVGAPPDEMPEHVRIPFAAVASQLPSTIFLLAVEDVGGRLPQPGHILIPTELVLPQLADGFVQVGWDAIASQFPDSVLARPRQEIATKILSEIVLPLEFIVPQLSAEFFGGALEAVDTRHLESFPMPFQTPDDVAAEMTSEVQTPRVETPEERAAPWTPAEEPEDVDEQPLASMVEVHMPPFTSSAVTVPEDIAGDDVSWERSWPDSVAPDDVSSPEPIAHETVSLAEVSLASDWSAEDVSSTDVWEEGQSDDPVPPAVMPAPVMPAPPMSAPLMPSVALSPVEPSPVAPREIRLLFARLNRFDLHAESVDGTTVYRASAPGIPADTVRALTARLLPFLGEGWSGPVEQITVRGARMAVVVTALGEPGTKLAVLAAAADRGPSLAFIELLGRQGAAAWEVADDEADAAEPERWPQRDGRADLAYGIAGPELLDVAPRLAAFGGVAPGSFEAADGARVHAFVDPDISARAVAAFALDVFTAMAAAPEAGGLGPVESVTCRKGSEHVVVRGLPGALPRIVVAAGTVTRSGRAQGELARAAAALADPARGRS